MNKKYEKIYMIIKNEKYHLIQFSFARIKNKKEFSIISNMKLMRLLMQYSFL